MKAGPLLLIGASLIGLLILGAAAAVLISAAPAIAQELAISMVDPGVLRWGRGLRSGPGRQRGSRRTGRKTRIAWPGADPGGSC
jgi:hypothetical protein